MVESHIQFKLNGRIHTKNVFQKDLDFALNGKKIVKSIQNRLENFANYLYKARKGNTYSNSQRINEFKNNIKINKSQFYAKFINISQSFGMKIELNSQPYSYKKPINIFTANFNKIVRAGIRIKSFIFTFSIPNSDLIVKNDQIDTFSFRSAFSGQDNNPSNFEILYPKPDINQEVIEEKPRIVTKKLSTKSKSYVGNCKRVNIPQKAEIFNAFNNTGEIPTGILTPFEHFILCSTPFVTQVLETDTLLTIFKGLESVSDLGMELCYKNKKNIS